MIWILLATYLFGGGVDGVNGSQLKTDMIDEWSRNVVTIVDDPARVGEAKKIFKELKKELKSFEDTFSKSGEQLTESYLDHAADKEQALATFDNLNSHWETMQLRAIDLRFELRNHVSEQEWAELFAAE